MHGVDLIGTLAGGLAAALLFGYITQRLGLSPIVGYLLGGLLVGPHTPGFVADPRLAEQLAEIGIILLMFGVGLQFHVEELLAVRRVAVPGAVAQSVAATLLGAGAASMFGWDWTAGLVFGVALSVASTVVLIRILADNNDLHTAAGHIAVGWLVVEDLFTVIVLVVLPVLFGGASSGSGLAVALAVTALKVSALVAFIFLVGNRALPWLLDRVAATRSRELFTLTVLVLALGIAVGSAAVFGVSMALGAFLAGLVVGRSDYSSRAAAEALPMRDAFAVLFFVSVGMLLHPGSVVDSPALAFAALGIVIIGKPLTAALVTWLMNYPLRTTLTVAVALSQIGEFSFILVTLGRDLAIVPAAAMDIVVLVAIISITLNPLAFSAIDRVDRWVAHKRAARVMSVGTDDDMMNVGASSSLDPDSRAIVIGYGPTGRTVSRLLRENGISPTVVDLNIDHVRALRDEGLSAVHGDARYADTLVNAGLPHAGTLIVSGADTGSPDVIKGARQINPNVHIFVRGNYLRDVPPLRSAGAEEVFAGEGEVAMAMTEAVLRRLGATPDQIDRERARVRSELFIS